MQWESHFFCTQNPTPAVRQYFNGGSIKDIIYPVSFAVWTPCNCMWLSIQLLSLLIEQQFNSWKWECISRITTWLNQTLCRWKTNCYKAVTELTNCVVFIRPTHIYHQTINLHQLKEEVFHLFCILANQKTTIENFQICNIACST